VDGTGSLNPADYGSLERSTISEPSSTPDENRRPSPSPLRELFVEATWQSRIAEGTAPTLIKVITSKLVPIALDEHLTTRPAIGRVVFLVVNVADINVSQPGGERLFARTDERFGRSCRDIEHFEVRMERRKMQRDVRAEILQEPIAESRDFFLRIIVARNQ
jgi:hypothetical protein